MQSKSVMHSNTELCRVRVLCIVTQLCRVRVLCIVTQNCRVRVLCIVTQNYAEQSKRVMQSNSNIE